MNLQGHIYSTLRNYSIIINHENAAIIPLEFKEIIDRQKKIDQKNMKKSMPRFDDFVSLNEQYKISLSLELYINFLLEYLAGIMTRIFHESAASYKEMAKDIINYFTKTILAREKTISKQEPYIPKKENFDESSSSESDSASDEWTQKNTQEESENSDAPVKAETYENELTQDGYDVENANDIWDND
jgi:hypothetical protein